MPDNPAIQGRCPSDAEWCAYTTGEMDELESAILQHHLETCRACFIRLAQVTKAVKAGTSYEARPAEGPVLWSQHCTLANGDPCRHDPKRRTICAARGVEPECGMPLD